MKKKPGARKREWIGENHFDVEGRVERKESVQRQVERVIRAELAFSRQIEAAEDRWHPVEAEAVLQRAGVEVTERIVKVE